MELLVIKSGAAYIRIRETGIVAVGLDKASVWPLARLNQVEEQLGRVQNSGFPEAAIFRLTLTETRL